MSDPLINVEAPKTDVETAAAVAGAVGEILTIAGCKRTPEAVLLRALDVLAGAFSQSRPGGGGSVISGCSILGTQRNEGTPEGGGFGTGIHVGN